MHIHKYLKEFCVELLLVILLAALSFGVYNPYWIPMGFQLVLLTALVVLFGFFAVFLWREQGGDEREAMLRHMSDRVGFLVGAFILLIAILVDGIVFHAFNGWIVGALVAMIAAKVLNFIYYDGKNQLK